MGEASGRRQRLPDRRGDREIELVERAVSGNEDGAPDQLAAGEIGCDRQARSDRCPGRAGELQHQPALPTCDRVPRCRAVDREQVLHSGGGHRRCRSEGGVDVLDHSAQADEVRLGIAHPADAGQVGGDAAGDRSDRRVQRTGDDPLEIAARSNHERSGPVGGDGVGDRHERPATELPGGAGAGAQRDVAVAGHQHQGGAVAGHRRPALAQVEHLAEDRVAPVDVVEAIGEIGLGDDHPAALRRPHRGLVEVEIAQRIRVDA